MKIKFCHINMRKFVKYIIICNANLRNIIFHGLRIMDNLRHKEEKVGEANSLMQNIADRDYRNIFIKDFPQHSLYYSPLPPLFFYFDPLAQEYKTF